MGFLRSNFLVNVCSIIYMEFYLISLINKVISFILRINCLV